MVLVMKAELKKSIDNIKPAAKKADALVLLSLMQKASGYSPYLSGSIIGFGQYHCKYESGREGDSCVTGFSLNSDCRPVIFGQSVHLLAFAMPD